MTTQDLQQAIFAGNDIAMQWYALTHQQTGAQQQSVIVRPNPLGGGSATFSTGTLVIAGIAIIAAVYLLRN